MKRSDFITSLMAVSGLKLIPNDWVKNYHKIYLLQFFIAGFRFYKGPEMLGELKEGQLLKMVREPDNEYDECAIALYFNEEKIGFIPASVNETLSRLMDAELLEMVAEITHLEPNAATWENVAVVVYVLKETKLDESLPEKAAYLGQLYSPEYTTIKTDNDHVARVYTQHHYVKADELWTKILATCKSENIKNYRLAEYDTEPNQEVMLVNLNKLNNSGDKTIADKIIAISDEFEHLFGENGYISVSIETASSFIDQIQETIEVFDRRGTGYLELVLG